MCAGGIRPPLRRGTHPGPSPSAAPPPAAPVAAILELAGTWPSSRGTSWLACGPQEGERCHAGPPHPYPTVRLAHKNLHSNRQVIVLWTNRGCTVCRRRHNDDTPCTRMRLQRSLLTSCAKAGQRDPGGVRRDQGTDAGKHSAVDAPEAGHPPHELRCHRQRLRQHQGGRQRGTGGRQEECGGGGAAAGRRAVRKWGERTRQRRGQGR